MKFEPEVKKNSSNGIWSAVFDSETHICPPDMQVYRYQSLHVPSSKTHDGAIVCFNRNDFENMLHHWNILGSSGIKGNTWKYIEIK